MPRVTSVEAGGPNLLPFLDTLAFSEGTSNSPTTRDDGYDQIVGRTRFTSYASHPRVLVDLPRLGIKSTAAGRYQLLARYWDAYSKQLNLKDFSPINQDRIALQQIKERRAVDDILAGRFTLAISKCRNIWASLPGAGYGQYEHSIATLQGFYLRAGGTMEM
ncbi:glycoside hydrolase family 104 protein [Pigmentiphaga aceris]|uniref:Glycoside hydrolase family 104 protein n=1 Tax=Pigmentiphaga aceris TaxID=1940612 RepID=A0A5C0B4P0_9BURK|nr:glycoside hydrolase family 104 protein [Pigmentiphaga aceris]QEI07821.1 glycoside hydrolase family 104 protein [Pigmentiphaga aceris]